MRVGSLKRAIFALFVHCLPNILHTWSLAIAATLDDLEVHLKVISG